MPRSKRPPAYRLHKARHCAVVTLDGKNHYLGPFGSPESHEKYARLIAECRRGAAPPAGPLSPAAPSTINDLLLAFMRHAEKRYVKHGAPTSEVRSFCAALRPVRQLGRQPIGRFGPLALAACKQALIDSGIVRKRVNQHLSRIRLVFKWGVSQEMVDESIWRALCAVPGARRGEAIDNDPVRPVPEEDIAAIEKYVTPQVWALIQLQLWSGCRPGEACMICGRDIQMLGEVWEYRPASHKTEHHDKERVIYLGPQAQKSVRTWLKSDVDAYLYSPREARAWSQQQRAILRKHPPSPKRRKGRKSKPRRSPGTHYTTSSYDHAIRRACLRAAVPVWSPHRLRHNAGTRIRTEFGIESARIILGVASIATTQIYAEVDREKARRIISEVG